MLLIWHGFDDEDAVLPAVSGIGTNIPLRKKSILDDDEAIIIVSMQLAQTFWKKDE